MPEPGCCEAAVRRAIEALRLPAVRVPIIAATHYLDAPRGTVEAISEWRAQTPGHGRRELLVRIVEEDGRWAETVVQEPAPPPPPPRPRLVLRRESVFNVLAAVGRWLGR